MGLTTEEYRILSREYEERRLANEHELRKRKEALYERIPMLSEIDGQLVHGSVQAMKLALSGNTSSLEVLERTNNTLIQQKRDCLVRNGYPADYLDPIYTCPLCKDTGLADGVPCQCFKQAVIDRFYMDEGRRKLLEKENFSTFSLDFYSKTSIDRSTGKSYYDIARNCLNQAHSFTDRFGSAYENLLVSGNTGVGKTFLTNCIAEELLRKGYTVLYLSAFRLFEIFEQYRFGNRENSQRAMQDFDTILDCDLLIIDDLGTEMSNSYTTSQLFICLEERDLRKKSTLISTNLTMDELGKRYSERIASRLFGFRYIKLFGKDIRILQSLT